MFIKKKKKEGGRYLATTRFAEEILAYCRGAPRPAFHQVHALKHLAPLPSEQALLDQDFDVPAFLRADFPDDGFEN